MTTDKLKQVNLLESLPYEVPKEIIIEDIEVDEDVEVETEVFDDSDIQLDEDGQITLF